MVKSSKPRSNSKPSATEKYLREGERARLRREKARVKADVARERDYNKKLRELEKVGAYTPKAGGLTRYRKSQINRRYREIEPFLDTDRYAFVKLSKGGLKYAKQPQMQAVTTKKGMFIEREHYQKIYERKSKTFKGETEVRKAWKAKTGVEKGKWLEDLVPLVDLEVELEEGEENVRNLANAYGKLGPNERLTFILTTGGHYGYSYNTYSNVDLMIADIRKRYKRNDADMVEMLATLIVRKTTLTNGNRPARAVDWNTEAAPYRPKKRKRKGKHYGSHKGRG